MANKIIKIDLSKWSTQQQFARDNNIPLNRISQRIKRTKDGTTKNPLEILEIPELNNLVLINKLQHLN
jgi:hypothetical protein